MSHVEALVQQIWERPEDDELRLVLADALIAIGDPRGELIQVQYAAPGERGGEAMRLLQRHGLTWLGALRAGVIPVAYERGFLASCVVFDERAVSGCVEWSTVHTVELDEDVETMAFAFEPVMRSLKCLAGVPHPLVRRLLDEATVLGRLRELGLRRWTWLPEVYVQLDRLPGMGRVSAEGLSVERGEDRRLSRMTARFDQELAGMLARLPGDALTRVVVQWVPRAERRGIELALERQERMQQLVIREIPDPET